MTRLRGQTERPDILTIDGDYFNFLNPEASRITITAIAQGLSNLCRFTGQCKEFYSVAQHSYLASTIVPPEHAFAALMHDAAEAYLGDVSRPLKQLLPDYRRIETRVESAIAATFNLPATMPSCIKQADLVLLATEQRDLMNAADHVWSSTAGVTPLVITIQPLPPHDAYALFLHRFWQLQHAKKVFPHGP
jgi:5'-deoxynucleotidase YfbR-like HD superfamily hydrolase